MRDYIFKVLIIGTPRSGKTKLLNRLTGEGFEHKYRQMIGVEVGYTTITKKDEKFTLQFWDYIRQHPVTRF